MKNLLRSGVFLLAISSSVFAQQNPVKYVNPLIGTEKMGHTFPGATVPFGAVQLSPDTDTIPYDLNGKYNADVYKYCAGYRYEDKTIVGFSHTHFSGTGHSDLGDLLVMPTTGALQLNPGTAAKPETGYRQSFSHQNEKAEAGYYKVLLEEYKILAELTATERTGVHRYTFPASDQAHVILDLKSGLYNYPDKNVWTYARVSGDTLITGYRQTTGWARTRTVYFAMIFSKPFKSYGQKNWDKTQVYKGFWRKFDQTENFPEIAGRQVTLHFDFSTKEQEQILLKVAISPVSQENALANLNAEVPGWDFDKVRRDAGELWNRELGKIEIKAPEDDKVNFYTALYHAFINPTVYMDRDRSYRGLDQQTHTAPDFVNYTTFSLWDTYRALHPFFNLVQPSRNNDIAHSMMAHYDQSALKMLPIWSHYANDNWCMSGYHSVSVLADAIIKGVYTGDPEKALAACVETANHRKYEGIGEYMDKGYVPDEVNANSVSHTLEYAYDDWCIAMIARKLGKSDLYDQFIKRAGYWRNVYDAGSGFMRPRLSDGTFRKNFDVYSTHGQGFIEGNSWNYSFFVPHQIEEMIAAMGGPKKFGIRLDSLFSMHLSDEFFAETEDISREGIIGGYVHGNEPAHHVAYLYNWIGQPWKTQEKVRMILKMQYKSTPDGLGGNDDCGQMSAWYMFSALGLYPVAPGSPDYTLGSPLVEEARIKLENGNEVRIEAVGQSDKNVYVKKVLWNGNELKSPFISHLDLVKGGKLVFYMSPKPVKK